MRRSRAEREKKKEKQGEEDPSEVGGRRGGGQKLEERRQTKENDKREKWDRERRKRKLVHGLAVVMLCRGGSGGCRDERKRCGGDTVEERKMVARERFWKDVQWRSTSELGRGRNSMRSIGEQVRKEEEKKKEGKLWILGVLILN